MDPQVDRAIAAARARGIEIRAQIGRTATCETWAVGDALVMRIPRSEAETMLARGDGPFMLGDVRPAPAMLLDLAIDRQRDVVLPVLARFVDRLELDGVPVALHERPAGRPVAAGDDLRVVARALATLHDTFGCHGHLVPAHILVDGDRVTFTDPLPLYPNLVGALGYALPIASAETTARDEGLLLRDVAALVAIAASFAGCDLGWDTQFVSLLARVPRMSKPWDARPALHELARRTSAIADVQIRGWIDAASRLVLDHYLPTPSVRPPSVEPRRAEPGTARSLLAQLDLHAALGILAARIAAPPSLFEFLAIERGFAIDAGAWHDATMVFAQCEPSFARIAAAIDELDALYGKPAPSPVAPITHPEHVYAESYPLRALLLDLDRLLAPTPSTFPEAGGRIARVRASIAALQDPTVRSAAARRYVNYVEGPGRLR